MNLNRIVPVLLVLALSAGMAGCEPEVGSDRWCSRMEDRPSGDWSANDAMEYARNCVLN